MVKTRLMIGIRKIFSVWIIVQIGFVYSANAGDIVITEFFYNKSAGNLPEYVELYNKTEAVIDLNSWKVDIDGIQIEIDGEYCNLGVLYSNESDCENAEGIWNSFSINSNGYVVILSSSGLLRNEGDTTYCSSSNYGFPFNVCDSTIDNLFGGIGTFSDLENTSGTIKIWDNSSTPIVIDSVAYDGAESFPVGEGVLGKAAVFIIDPKSDNAHVKNDDGLNWRSSEHPSDYLWNGSSRDFGSPLSPNFITPTISISANSNSNSDSTQNTVCSYTESKTICIPHSDGYPGGYAAIELLGTAINYNNNAVSLDSLYWTVYKNNILVDSKSTNVSVWHPNPLLQDTNLTSSVYTIPLVTRNTDGFLGKTDTTIYINQEINEKPSVVSINGQSSQAVINIFENTYDSVFAEVTDPELCSSIDAPCNFDSLTFNSSFFDNSSPFLWTLDSSNLLSSINILAPKFIAPQIYSLNEIGANFIRDTLEFQIKTTDPFGASDSNSIKVIVHNKNQKPEIILNSANINEIDLIAGYSNKFIVKGDQIELYEYDASGVIIDTTLIAQITDIDNDLNFTIIPQGYNCGLGFENNYCVSGTTIKSSHKVSYDSLLIPFMVDDGVSSPIEGFNSESTSDTSFLVIQNIKKVTNTVTFDDPIIALDEYFHLPEDSTLVSEIPFYIDFKLDGDNAHSVNWDSLQWSFHKLDSENEQRIFAYKTGEGFKIDSLSNNFNGQTGLKVFVTDNDNTVASLSDSLIINIPIYIDQRNDTLKHFNLYHDIKNYSIISSTIDTIRDVRYFRLEQYTGINNESNPTPKKLLFEWERNDNLDIDTDNEINKDAVQNIFYRLELIDTLTNVVSILKDSLYHNNFLEFENIWAEIDFQRAEYPYYYDSLGYIPPLENHTIDINGLSTYRWRVVAKNYWQDDLGKDPVEISQDWNLTDFKIDIIQPEVAKLDIILNEMYAGFYDLLWSSTEAFLTDSTFLSIKEETNQFSAISMLNPRQITDNLFHFTGIIPTDLVSVSITFDLQIRDNAMNSGERIDEVSYNKVSPNTTSLLISPSSNVSISLPENSVLEPVHIIITEENNNIAGRENDSEFYQITSTIHVYPKDLTLNKPGSIEYDISDYISSEIELWKLVIVKIGGLESVTLPTIIIGETLTASIEELGNYAVFMDSTLEKPLPSKFELKMNYPNPFNPSTTIPIELPEESFVSVVIYNILGEKVVELSEGIKSSGYHNINWDGTNQFGKQVSSGIYFVRVHFGQNIYNQKMMLLK